MAKIKIPKTVRGQQTLNKLCGAAETLFYKSGYHKTAVKDITTEAGVGLGTFYIYFPDKKSIYVFLLMQYSQYIRMNIALQIKGIEDRKKSEKIGLLTFLEVVRSNPHMYHIIWESLYIDKSLFEKYYMDFAKHYSSALQKAQAEGKMQAFDTELVAFMLMGVANFVGLRYVLFENNEALESLVDQVIERLDKGLFAP